MQFFSKSWGKRIWHYLRKGEYHPLPDNPFGNWLATRTINDEDDGDPLDFLVDRYIAEKVQIGPDTRESLLNHFASLGTATPLRWSPTPVEWVSLYSTPSSNGQSISWLAQRFLESQRMSLVESNIAAISDALMIAGFAVSGVDGPSTVTLNPSIPRVLDSVEPVDVEIFFHTRGPN